MFFLVCVCLWCLVCVCVCGLCVVFCCFWCCLVFLFFCFFCVFFGVFGVFWCFLVFFWCFLVFLVFFGGLVVWWCGFTPKIKSANYEILDAKGVHHTNRPASHRQAGSPHSQTYCGWTKSISHHFETIANRNVCWYLRWGSESPPGVF